MRRFDTIIVGGGAAGISAAISARRRGSSVAICEKMPSLGKKILVSGNGRCNLSNEKLDESSYNYAGRGLVRSVFAKFGEGDIRRFFEELGIRLYSQEGRIFPVTNQSASVLKVLELELARLSIPVKLNFDVTDIASPKGAFVVTSKTGEKMESSNLVLAGGGKTYPALGSDGSAYGFAADFGHTIIEPVPSAVPLVIKDRFCHLLQGQRIFAKTMGLVNGKSAAEASGEVLFTKYGLSGTAILDISGDISAAVNRRGYKDVYLSVDMAPFMTLSELSAELARRLERKMPEGDILTGILPNKFGPALRRLLDGKGSRDMAQAIKDIRFKVVATRGWNEAEFTSGGVRADEVREGALESKIKKGLYFAGEILDVDGKRGGFNLAWAWASGFAAGLTL